jgi:hypothetical protein
MFMFVLTYDDEEEGEEEEKIDEDALVQVTCRDWFCLHSSYLTTSCRAFNLKRPETPAEPR